MENSNSKLILSFLAGIAAGTAVGVLLAPDSGEKTRKKIRDKMNDLETDLEVQMKKQFDEIKTGVNNMSKDLKEKADEFVKQGEERLKKS